MTVEANVSEVRCSIRMDGLLRINDVDEWSDAWSGGIERDIDLR